MRAFDNPSARSLAGILAFFVCFLAAGLHIEFIVVQAACGLRWKADIGRVGALGSRDLNRMTNEAELGSPTSFRFTKVPTSVRR
jgi:hypothetical protein